MIDMATLPVATLRIDHGAQRQLLQVHELRLNIGMQLDSGSDDVRARAMGGKAVLITAAAADTLS